MLFMASSSSSSSSRMRSHALTNIVGLVVMLIAIATSVGSVSAQLSQNYYSKTCPKLFPTVYSVVRSAVSKERRMGASLLRLFFHDCFVNVLNYIPYFSSLSARSTRHPLYDRSQCCTHTHTAWACLLFSLPASRSNCICTLLFASERTEQQAYVYMYMFVNSHDTNAIRIDVH